MECEHAASLTARAVKVALPERAILAKDARATLNSATSMFTLYLASVAHDTAVANKRQTVTLRDVLQSLKDMDFEHFIGPIEECLQETKVTAAMKKSKKAPIHGDTETPNIGNENDQEAATESNGEGDDDEPMQSAEEPTEAEDTEDDDGDEEDDGEFKNSEPPAADREPFVFPAPETSAIAKDSSADEQESHTADSIAEESINDMETDS